MAVLQRDQFINTLDRMAFKVQVNQAKPTNLHEAFGKALKFECIIQSSQAEITISGITGFKAKVNIQGLEMKTKSPVVVPVKEGAAIFQAQRKEIAM